MCNDDTGNISPFTVCYVPGKGRCLSANKDIQPLEIILSEAPSVLAPNISASLTVCVVCLKENTECRPCKECDFPVCAEVCEDSEIHGRECLLLKNIQLKEKNYAVVSVVRLLLLKYYDEENWKVVELLMDHGEERRKSVVEWEIFQKNVVDPIVALYDSRFKEEEIVRAIGILNINCISFTLRKKEKFSGRGLYPTLSLMSHSCLANARYEVSSDPARFVFVRARRQISAGEEITIQYVPASLGQPRRRLELSDWYFDCHCERCQDVTELATFVSALKCPQCREGLILPQCQDNSLWRCRFCNAPYDLEMVLEIIENVEKQLDEISSNPSVKLYENFIRRNSPTLHIKHYLNLFAQKQIVELLSQEQEPTRDICKKINKYCKSYLAVMSRLDPGLSKWKGFMMRCHNVAQLSLLKLELEENIIDHNEFAVRSEQVWRSMKEVDQCNLLGEN